MTDLNFDEFDEILRKLAENRNPVEAMVDATLLDESEALVSSAYNCAIPRSFSVDLIIALSESPISDNEAKNQLETMKGWEFVQELGSGEFTYRQEVIQYFRTKLQKDNSARFTSLNQQAYRFFSSKLPVALDTDERVWLNLSTLQVDALREAIYHLLQYDPKRGFELFRKMFSRAIQLHLTEETFTLMKFIKQLDDNAFSPVQRLELLYFEAIQDHLDGNIESAEAKLKKVTSESQLPELQAQALTELGKLYFDAKRFDEAAKAFQDAQKIWVSHYSIRQSAALSNNIGNIYLSKKEYKQAKRYFEHALTGLEKEGTPAEHSQTLNNLGNLYRIQEEWNIARQFYEKSLNIKNNLGDHYGMAITRLNLGRLYQQLAQDTQNSKSEKEYHQMAEDNFTQSLNTFKAFGARSNQAFTLFSLARLLQQEGRINEARQNLNEAMETFFALKMQRELEMAKKLNDQLSKPH